MPSFLLRGHMRLVAKSTFPLPPLHRTHQKRPSFARHQRVDVSLLAVAESNAHYELLLQQARQKTFEAGTGPSVGQSQAQLHATPGRKSALEDAERILEKCIQLHPADLAARLLHLQNIMLQNLGRERVVPPLATQALSDIGAMSDVEDLTVQKQLMGILLLGLKALRKLHKEETIPKFLQDAQRAVPTLAAEFEAINQRLSAMLASLGKEQASRLLANRAWTAEALT